MDAATGDELDKTDWVDEDSHRVFPFPVEAPSFGARALVSNPATRRRRSVERHQRRRGRGVDAHDRQQRHAYTDLNDDDLPDAGSSPDGGAGLVFDFPLDLTQPPSTYRPAAVSNLYYANNRIHDVLYRYGFNEPAGNFQVNNYGNGGAGQDPVNAEAQDGGGTNNANFGTPPDGSRPRMQMFVWTTANPNLDGDFDNGIIVHEYGHGVSNRLTGGPTRSCLGNQEQGGEGWSDYLAYMLTMPNGTEPAGGRGIGTYALNQPTNGAGIRTKKYSPTWRSTTTPTTRSRPWSRRTGSARSGQRCCGTSPTTDRQVRLHANLITGNAGNNKSLQLVMDGMKLQPCSPGFVDARDAILAADQADYAGADQCLIWEVFARRGLAPAPARARPAAPPTAPRPSTSPTGQRGGPDRDRHAEPGARRSPLTYKLHLENTTRAPVNGVSVTSEPGDHVSYVAGSANCGGTYSAGTDTVTFPIGTMASGATRDCQFRALVATSPSGTIVVQRRLRAEPVELGGHPRGGDVTTGR